MQEKQLRIGELAKKLEVEPFVIRFWEKEFNIKPQRSAGQQRFYSEKELAKFVQIKELLYKRGMTIAGAKKQLSGAHKTTIEIEQPDPINYVLINKKLKEIKQQLVKLRKLL